MSGCDIAAVAMDNARWSNCSLVGIELGACSLDKAEFERCCFIRAVGNGVDLRGVRFRSCNLYQGEYRNARIREAEGSIFAECELAGADLIEANLKGCLFAGSKAPGARFERAVLDGAMFPKAPVERRLLFRGERHAERLERCGS